MLEVVVALPPMFDEIDRAFGVAGKPVIFCWGRRIYNPTGGVVTPELQAHEGVHSRRQGDDPRGWWERYLVEPAMRLEEEVLAHQAEVAEFCRRHTDRNARVRYRAQVARRLSGPVYGRAISYPDALRRIVPK